jgi:hypothetical protein
MPWEAIAKLVGGVTVLVLAWFGIASTGKAKERRKRAEGDLDETVEAAKRVEEARQRPVRRGTALVEWMRKQRKG